MIKRDAYSFAEMNMDLPPSRRGKSQYFLLRNGRITNSFSEGDAKNIASDGVIRCQSGNELKFSFTSIDSIYNNAGDLTVTYKISGVTKTKAFSGVVNSEITALNSSLPSTSIEILAAIPDGPTTYFLTTSNKGIDCVWGYDEVNGLDLKYINNLEWNGLVEKNMDVLINTESESVVKMYIADGEHQILSINLVRESDLSKPKKVLYMVPQYTFSQPKLKLQLSTGAHTAGSIQYTYNLFNVNGGQTKLAPASELIFMGRNNGGGDVNEVVGKSNVIIIDNIDLSYDYIKIYSVKYGELNTSPVVSVVGEYAIANNPSITITDDGRAKTNVTLSELTFLGGTEIIPRCIINKKNRLLLGNIKEELFDVNDGLSIDDLRYFDSRAYSSDGTYVKIKDKYDGELTLDPATRGYLSNGVDVPIRHDCIQDKSVYKYHPVYTTTPGGEGRHISYKIVKTSVNDIIAAGYDPNSSRYMKVGETYRWAIKFYNDKSQESTPQWIADVKVPEGFYGFTDNTRVTIEFEISSEGSDRLIAQGITGYKFLRVERQESDRSVVAQGIVTPMIFQEVSGAAKVASNNTQGDTFKDNNVKVSCPWVRHYQDQIDIPKSSFPGNYNGTDVKINKLKHLQCISEARSYTNTLWSWPCVEIYRDENNDPQYANWLHFSYQDNRLMQLFSPESIFGNPQLFSGMKFRIAASLRQETRNVRAKDIAIDTNTIKIDTTKTGRTNVYDPSRYGGGSNPDNNTARGNFIHSNGYIGPNKPLETSVGVPAEQLIHYYRQYAVQSILAVKSNGSINEVEIEGAPELSKYDSSIKSYNGQSELRYTNSLQSIIADGRQEIVLGNNNNDWNVPIYGVDAIASSNITFAESSRTVYETIFSNAFTAIGSSPSSNDNVLLGEIVVTLASQYGGNTFEDRSINKYMAVGEYKRLTPNVANTYKIINNGDVFVADFIFTRIARINGAQFVDNRLQMAEVVKFPVETTININQRSDSSNSGWDAYFLPTNEESHDYNNAFSQEPNALTSQPDPYLFTKNTEFTNRLMATKPKISGETIDSWTDILVNEELYLEGEYGAINRLVKYNDNIYSFQRDAVSMVSVLPRVQINPSDSIAIELGVGNVLNNFQYINTNSGCADFDGVISTSSAVYYGDRIRRTINIIDGDNVTGLSDVLGMSTYVKGYDTNLTYKPKYVLGFDPIADDVFFTITKQSSNDTGTTETLVYNEKIRKFTSILDLPASFIYTIDGKLYSTPKSNESQVWNHFIGHNSCNFYGIQYSMELTVCLNPEGAINDNIFNALEWTHDVVSTESSWSHYDENINAFYCWNDYLISHNANMTTDLQRRFRMSRLFIPRAANDSISRMRGHYLYATLRYDPSSPYKTILLNDLILYYNAQR